MSEKTYDIAVIGAGAAGSMGALRAVLNGLDAVCFMGDGLTKKKARATWVGKVENMPVLFDYPKAVFQSAREVFDWIGKQDLWKDHLDLVKDTAAKIEGQKGAFTITTNKGESYSAKHVVLCTGIMDVQPEVNGDIKAVFPMANAGHVEYCIRCDGHRTKGKEVALIGHAETTAWIGALLKERYNCPRITILTNGKEFEAKDDSPIHERIHCYEMAIETEAIDEFVGDPKKEGLTGIKLKDGKTIPCQIAFVSLGTIVYNELAQSLGCEIDERGYVRSDKSGETNIPGVFVAGDLRADHKKQIYTAWDITVDAVDKIDSYIRAERREKMLKNCPNRGEEQLGARM